MEFILCVTTNPGTEEQKTLDKHSLTTDSKKDSPQGQKEETKEVEVLS